MSRDAVESEPAYLYVRGNPINFTDSTGMYRYYSQDEVAGIQTVMLPWIFDSARRHNMPNTNMGDGAFAALIVSLIKREGNGQIIHFHKGLNAALLQLIFVAEDCTYYWLREDKSLGPGNIKASAISDLTHGRVRKTNGFEELDGSRKYFDVQVDYNLKPLPYSSLQKHTYATTNPDEWAEQLVTLMQFRNLEYSVDLVGAQLQQGAMYAVLKKQELREPSETLGVFNFLTWYNGGVILNKEINGPNLGQGRIEEGSIARRYALEFVQSGRTGFFYEALDIVRKATINDGVSRIFNHQFFNYELGDAYYTYLSMKKREVNLKY